MDRTLWTFGCSYTDDLKRMTKASLEFGGSPFYDYKIWKGYIPESWPTLLSEKLESNLQNQGKGSASNDHILRSFMENFSKIRTDDIVIIGWTHIVRFPWVVDDDDNGHEFIDVNPVFSTEQLSEKTKNEILVNRTYLPWQRDLLIKINFIKFLCEKNQINLYFWTSCHDTFDYLHKMNNTQNFITYENWDNIFQYIYSDIHNQLTMIKTETNYEIHDSHLGEIGHKMKAQLFYEFISNNKDII